MNINLKYFLFTLGTVIGSFFLGFGIGGYLTWAKWNKAEIQYQQNLQNTKNMYEQQLEDLHNYNDSVEYKIKAITHIIDSLNTSITNRNEALDSLKQKYDEQIDHINNMSHNELVEFFSNRY